MIRKFRIWVCIVTAVFAAAAVSCSKFAYTTSDNDQTVIYAAVPTASSESCHVMMSRLVNSRHYVWEIDGDPRKVYSGEYYAVAYRASDMYAITSLQEFRENPSVSMQEVYAVIPADTEDYGKLAQFNPYSSFVSGADGVLEVDFKRVSVVDSAMVMTFFPETLTQRVTFRLKVRTGAGVEIVSLRAAISGVPSKVRLMSGMVRNDVDNSTHRQYVPMSKTGSGVYEGSVSVLGLFPPVSASHTSGPGIFQVEVKAGVDQDGRRYERMFYAGINLKSAIEQAALMEASDDRSGFRVRVSEALIEVPVVLDVRADSVVSGEGEGMEHWFENDADIEVEV